MVAAIRQIITVQEDGRIEIRSSQLQTGATAEVIVLLEPQPAEDPLAVLDELQRSMKMDRSTAQAWADRVRDERTNSTRDPGRRPG